MTTSWIPVRLRNKPPGLFDLSKLPEDASKTLRIVRIGDYDVCACIGAQVSNTSENRPFLPHIPSRKKTKKYRIYGNAANQVLRSSSDDTANI